MRQVPADLIWSPPNTRKSEWGKDLTPAMGHAFDARLRCECGVGWWGHRYDPYPCTAHRDKVGDWQVRREAGETFGAIARDAGVAESTVRRALSRRERKK